jgi:hypothetical protein
MACKHGFPLDFINLKGGERYLAYEHTECILTFSTVAVLFFFFITSHVCTYIFRFQNAVLLLMKLQESCRNKDIEIHFFYDVACQFQKYLKVKETTMQ